MELESPFAAGRKMSKDFKIGMLFGLILVSIAGILFSISPAISVKSRLQSLLQSKENFEAHTEKKQIKSLTQENRIKNEQLSKENKTRFHTVLEGETLSEIATRYYGSAIQWAKIREANPEVNVKKLQPGTTLIIPP